MNDPLSPRLGTVIRAASGAAASIRALLPHGFESWQLAFALKRDVIPPLEPLAEEVRAILGGTVVSAIGIYGNPLRDDALGAESRRALREAMHTARHFGTNVIGCFTGRVPCASVEDSLPRFREIWSELAREAADCGVRIAFENCLQGGTWQSGSIPTSATYYAEGNVRMNSTTGSSYRAVSVIATGNIDVQPNSKLTPENSEKIQFVCDGDLTINASDLDETANIDGQILVRGQMDAGGSMEFQGRILIQDVAGAGTSVANGASRIHGSVNFVYNGSLGAIQTTTTTTTTGATTYVNNVLGWMEQ